jgi:hypothetical protein
MFYDKYRKSSDKPKEFSAIQSLVLDGYTNWSRKNNDEEKKVIDEIKESRVKSNAKISFIDYAKSNLKNETINAILNIFKTSNRIHKTFLILFVLVAHAFFSYMALKVFTAYFDYEVVSKIRTEYESSPLFPRITLCQSNTFSTKFGYEILKNISENVFNETFLNTMDVKMKLKILNALRYQALAHVATKFSDSDKKKISHTMYDTLLTCKFNLASCSPSDFIWTWDDYHGNCYVFNSGVNLKGENIALKKSNLAGYTFGLIMDLYVNGYEKLKLFNLVNRPQGILIKVDNTTRLINNVNTIHVSGGAQVYIGLKRSFNFYLPKPYSNCDLENGQTESNLHSEVYDLIRYSKFDYTQQLCLIQCAQSLILAACNCTYTKFTSLFNATQCSTDSSINCAISTYYGKYLDVYDSYCIPQCPLECNLTEFSNSYSFENLKGDPYVYDVKSNPNLSMDFEQTQINGETLSECVSHVRLFYESLSYTISTEIPEIDVISLLAQLGGHLGLCLGVSFVTLGEVLHVLIEIYFLSKSQSK